MTRINVGIDVRELTDEHLMAEHREIKRLPWCLEAAIRSGSIDRVPEKFTLGKGHVLFFMNKMKYTYSRYQKIHTELLSRGIRVQDYGNNWKAVDEKYFQDYVPNSDDRWALIDRITTRIRESKKDTWHYRGEPITKEEAIKLLRNE